MIKSILGGKSKNLFDISKVAQSAKLKNNGNGTLTVSGYGVSAGILKDLCPNIKIGDTIKAYYTPISWTAQNPPYIININSHILDRTTNSSFVVTEADLNGKVYFYNNNYSERELPGTTVIGNIFITNDTTVTASNYKDRYVPHELTSYKSIMKVSDVCQLVDKNKIPTTRTISGVTFTNNGDGSITVNGTSTHQYYSEIVIPIDGSLFIPGHVYLNGTIAGDFAGFVALYGPVARDYIMAPQQIYTFPSGKDFNKFRYIIRVRTGMTANNYKCTPQPFDLTKTFGAGNEPKTVAEFKAKFPNDYYPYSPSCFVTSFDERMPCKTKNLFISSTKTGNAGAFNNTTVRSFEENIWYIGLSRNNYNAPDLVYIHEIKDNYIKVATRSSGYGVTRAFKVSPNKQYTISFKGNLSTSSVGFGFYDNTGKYLSERTDTFTVTTPTNCGWLAIVFGAYPANTEFECTDIQLELGTTATDYVPYGYV